MKKICIEKKNHCLNIKIVFVTDSMGASVNGTHTQLNASVVVVYLLYIPILCALR